MGSLYVSLLHGLGNLWDQTEEALLAHTLLGFLAIGRWLVPFVMALDGPST